MKLIKSLDITEKIVISIFIFFASMFIIGIFTPYRPSPGESAYALTTVIDGAPNYFYSYPSATKVKDSLNNPIYLLFFKSGSSSNVEGGYCDATPPNTFRKAVSFNGTYGWSGINDVINYNCGQNYAVGALSNNELFGINYIENTVGGTIVVNQQPSQSTDLSVSWTNGPTIVSSYIANLVPVGHPIEPTNGNPEMSAYSFSISVPNRIDASILGFTNYGSTFSSEHLLCTGVQNGIGCNEPIGNKLNNGAYMFLIRDNGGTGSDNEIRYDYQNTDPLSFITNSISDLPIAFPGSGEPNWIQLSSNTCVAVVRDTSGSGFGQLYYTTATNCIGGWTLFGQVDASEIGRENYADIIQTNTSPVEFNVFMGENDASSGWTAKIVQQTYEETSPGTIIAINTPDVEPAFTNTMIQGTPTVNNWTIPSASEQMVNGTGFYPIGVQLKNLSNYNFLTESSLSPDWVLVTNGTGTATFTPSVGVAVNSIVTSDVATAVLNSPYYGLVNGVITSYTKFKVTGSASNLTGSACDIGLWNGVTAFSNTVNSVNDYRTTAAVYGCGFGGGWYLFPNGTPTYWDFSTSTWVTGGGTATDSTYTPGTVRTLQVELAPSGYNIAGNLVCDPSYGPTGCARYTLFNSSGAVLYQTSWYNYRTEVIKKATTGNFTGPQYLKIGDPFNNLWDINGTVTITDVEQEKYPVSAYVNTGFFPIVGSHIYDIYLSDNPIAYNSGYTSVGSIAYDYAINNGSLNNYSLSNTDLRLKLRTVPITDHNNSLELKPTLISHGYPTDVSSIMGIITDKPSGGGGGGGGGGWIYKQ